MERKGTGHAKTHGLSKSTAILVFFAVLILAIIFSISGAAQDRHEVFRDHGVASPVSNHRGIVSTVDGEGRNVVLVWLFDHRGGYALLMIDAETGKSEEFPVPFDPQKDTPYASLLSTRNRYYTLFNSHFLEFDPVERAFTFHGVTMPKMAMGMTEDDNGIIWAVTYPNSGVVSFDPVMREMKDHGYVYAQNWRQYQRFVAADDQGWIYFGLGNTTSQIVAFHPDEGKGRPLLSEDERKRGTAYVYRDKNGKVYGRALNENTEEWLELYAGARRSVGEKTPGDPVPIITGSQGLIHPAFPDGSVLRACDLIERRLRVEKASTGEIREVAFDYSSEGAWVMGVGLSQDGRLSGGTTFPMRFFAYRPGDDRWVNERAFGQFNAIARQDSSFFFGVYPGGSLLEWNPSQPWTGTDKNKITNPRFLAAAPPHVYRPHRVLPHSDGRTVIMSGTPDYGYTGGGLLFWDRELKTSVVLTDADLIPDQSTMSMVSLPDGKVLGGTTTAPGSGGEKKASEALLYVIDPVLRKILWKEPVIPGVQEYSDLFVGRKGRVYGIADKKTFFVFDLSKRKVTHVENVEARFGRTTGEQSPRIFVRGDRGAIYLLFLKGIVKLSERPKLTLLAESPVPIDAGGDYFKGKIYFVSGSHIWSYEANR